MKATFYGVRGSIPTPGETTVKYGGNTTCIHIETDQADYLLDTGSGAVKAGNDLMKKHKGKVTVDVLLTHPHADHIQGFPFFTPNYVLGCTVKVSRETLYEKVSTVGNKSETTNPIKEV